MKKPEIGDRVRSFCPAINRDVEGVVDNLLSAQFVFVDDAGQRWMLLYTDQWRVIDGDN